MVSIPRCGSSFSEVSIKASGSPPAHTTAVPGEHFKIPVTALPPPILAGLLWGWGPGLRIFNGSAGDSGASDLDHELRHWCVLAPPGAHRGPPPR